MAARPSSTGIRMSSSATSARCRTAPSTAARPSAASPTTVTSGAESSTARTPARMSGSSSAISTRITFAPR
jgi:hypothetical protein